MNCSEPPSPGQLQQQRQTNLPRLLLQATRALNERIIKALHQQGHINLRSAHSALLTNLDVEGTRLTVLAQRADMTKQAMAELLTDLEHKGYVRRRPDPSDGRAKCIYFTELGLQALQDALAITDEIEVEFGLMLGQQGVEQLRAMFIQTIEQSRHSETPI